MRRGNRVYFKNRKDGVKSMLELNPMPSEVKEMKYGTKVNIMLDGYFY